MTEKTSIALMRGGSVELTVALMEMSYRLTKSAVTGVAAEPPVFMDIPCKSNNSGGDLQVEASKTHLQAEM
jgi:hypothetical protein